jgi:DNA polymerase I
MVRDFRLENHLFYPHMRNGSYGNFFEQQTDKQLASTDTATIAGSMHMIDREENKHPILDLEIEVSRVLAYMEIQGVFVKKEMFSELEIDLVKIIQSIESYVAHLTGEMTVNLASPLQLQKLLFETMQIKPLKKTKTGWSVDEETLTMIAEDHEIGKKILEHRHASKLLGTYVR